MRRGGEGIEVYIDDHKGHWSMHVICELLSCLRVPWFHYPIIYDIRARPKLLTSPTGSKDLQMVNIGLRVLYRPEQHQLPSMYRLLGTDYDDRVLPSICNEVQFNLM